MAGWVEIGDRVFVRRYAFFDQNIGVVLGGRRGVMVIDTRSTHVQAREILADLRELTAAPVTVVVDTHGHFDHAFGNHVFRPAPIWGHERCVTFMERTGEPRRATIAADEPEIAADLPEVVIDPPDRTFSETAFVDVGDRRVELRFLGRGHTDHDIVIRVAGRGRPVRRRPPRERRRAVVRRRLSARLAGDGLPRRRAGDRASSCRVTATTAARAFADAAGRGALRARRPRPPRPRRAS